MTLFKNLLLYFYIGSNVFEPGPRLQQLNLCLSFFALHLLCTQGALTGLLRSLYLNFKLYDLLVAPVNIRIQGVDHRDLVLLLL